MSKLINGVRWDNSLVSMFESGEVDSSRLVWSRAIQVPKSNGWIACGLDPAAEVLIQRVFFHQEYCIGNSFKKVYSQRDEIQSEYSEWVGLHGPTLELLRVLMSQRLLLENGFSAYIPRALQFVVLDCFRKAGLDHQVLDILNLTSWERKMLPTSYELMRLEYDFADREVKPAILVYPEPADALTESKGDSDRQ